jgi:hypothetical protein
MVPLRIKKVWQWLRNSLSWLLSEVNEKERRKIALWHISENIHKTRRILNIAGQVVELKSRYIHLRVESSILIRVDIDPIFRQDDPHLLCVIETTDLIVYEVAHKMLEVIASGLGVRLEIPDEEDFIRGSRDTALES